MPVRRARPTEFGTLSRLQSFLAEPAPALLSAADAVGTVLVSTDDRDRPVGYLLAVGADERGSPTRRTRSGAADGDCHVAELVVHPDYRREGRARALLETLLSGRPAGSAVTVAVAAENEAARSLYESVGFRKTGRRPEFFDGGDAVYYARTVE